MSRRVDSSLRNYRQEKSMFDLLFEFVLCPFVWVRDKIRLRRARGNVHLESATLLGHSKVKPSITEDHIANSRNSHAALENLEEEASRIPEASFLFIGLGGSGITTTAATLFEFNQDDSSGTDVRDLFIREISGQVIYSSQNKCQKLNLKVIDVPGLCKESYIEEDAEIITALNIHLKKSLANNIPSVTFIVTPFDDNRFEGEASQFSKMLTAISYSRQYWSDSHLSNVSLVLTHRSKTDASEIPNKIFRFQQAFSQVYPEMPRVDCSVVDLENSFSLKTQLSSAISRISNRRNEIVPETFLTFLKNGTVNAQTHPSEDRSISLQSLLPQNEGEVKTLLVSLLQGKVYEHLSSEQTEDEVEICPFFHDFFAKKSQIVPLSLPVAVSILPSFSKVLLSDKKTQLDVQLLRVGDKLLDRNLHSNVVTSIQMIQTSTNEYNGQPLGSIIAGIKEDDEDSATEDSADDWASNPLVLKYHNNKIRQMKFKKSDIQNFKSHNRFFIVNLDTPNATFIVDDHVLYARYDSALSM